MPKFLTNVTHWLTLAFVAIYGFSQSPAGQALIHQYPQLSGGLVVLGIISSVYHGPTQNKQ